MKVTRYPQSCLILEQNGKRLIIDPGSLVSAKYKAADLLPVDGILITHEHMDHVDPEFLAGLVVDSTIPVVANASAAKLLGPVVTKVITDGEEIELAGFKIQARELPHVDMVNGTPGPQNTGYLIDGAFFHPGDGLNIDGLKVDTAAVPIAGPDVSPRDVYDFIVQIGCSVVVPIHYDAFKVEPDFFEGLMKSNVKTPIRFVTLASGESAEI